MGKFLKQVIQWMLLLDQVLFICQTFSVADLKKKKYIYRYVQPSLSCKGVTVCLMSVLGVKPGQMGDSIIMSRLQKGSAPVTVHIPTSKKQVRMMNCIKR